MTKQLLVSSAIQSALMTKFLLEQIQTGFWKDQRPSNHGEAWTNVSVVVSETNTVGPIGFKSVRFYDFLNPEFTKIHEETLVNIAKEIKPSTTFKSLKKELIELARIIGGRMTDKTQEPARVFRGNNRSDFDVIRVVDHQKVMTVAGAKAAIDRATSGVKKTSVKKVDPSKNQKKIEVPEEGVIIVRTAAGATVRKVAVIRKAEETQV